MLVSSIAQFNALNTMANTQFASMQTTNAMMNNVKNNTFGGEHDLSMLNKIDNKLSLDLLTNKLLYKIAFLQEKVANKQLANEGKKSLNYLA